MSDHDLPPEFRRRNVHSDVLTIELPLDDDIPPPLLNPDRTTVDQQRNPEPYLRQS